MKLNTTAFANASGVLTGIVFIVCRLAVVLVPDLALSIAQSWIHGIDLSKIWNAQASSGLLILGFVTAVLGAWAAGWLFAWVYNKFVK